MHIAVAGLDRMGAAIVARLIEVGPTVSPRNRVVEKLRPLVEAGASAAASPAEFARAILAQGKARALELPLAERARACYEEAIRRGLGQHDLAGLSHSWSTRNSRRSSLFAFTRGIRHDVRHSRPGQRHRRSGS